MKIELNWIKTSLLAFAILNLMINASLTIVGFQLTTANKTLEGIKNILKNKNEV